MKKLAIILIALLIPSLALSHSGRTDSNGGHYNRKTGEYHYHGGGHKKPARIKTTRADKNPDTKSQIVYVTRTGHRYHKDGCQYLKSKIPITREEAEQRYTPCMVCKPEKS